MVLLVTVRYLSPDEDSARWLEFAFRPGDIVISTRSKSGTTWMQMICALLVFQTPDLPAPMAQLSPWLDWLVVPPDEVYEQLEAQRHRRFIKTHTPLDGLPLDPPVTYIVVARHPLDAAISLYHQGDNLDRKRLQQLTGAPGPTEPPAPRPAVKEWLLAWVERDVDPRQELDSLPGVMWHLTDAWRRRAAPNVRLVHYAELSADLEGQMRQLAAYLEIAVPEPAWPGLVAAAGFEAMRRRVAETVPDWTGVLKNPTAFFRRGRSGSARELLSADERARYIARAAELAPADLLAWLHREDQGAG
jgi:aryl sulfotransferase